MTHDTEVVIVGGGVIGLAAAAALTQAGREVIVIERNSRLGAETSSRNSEVIHAGIYYPHGSMRARLCTDGKKRLYDFAREHGIEFNKCGKILVATSDAQLSALDAIMTAAHKNGVEDLVELSAREVEALEPELACVAGCLSPSTGVINSHEFMSALEGVVTTHGGQIVLNTIAKTLSHRPGSGLTLEVVSGGETVTMSARHAVIAAGHDSPTLADTMVYPCGYRPPRPFLSKGHYYTYQGKAPFTHLVYPLPDGAWLGIHLTLDVAGNAKFGPDHEWTNRLTYEFEDHDGSRLAVFEREVRRYWPGLPEGRLQPAYTGIRPKIYGPGEPVADFAIHTRHNHGVDGLVALYGIESPGLTSSLAIGNYVADCVAAEVVEG